jgi:hypothetical protein
MCIVLNLGSCSRNKLKKKYRDFWENHLVQRITFESEIPVNHNEQPLNCKTTFLSKLGTETKRINCRRILTSAKHFFHTSHGSLLHLACCYNINCGFSVCTFQLSTNELGSAKSSAISSHSENCAWNLKNLSVHSTLIQRNVLLLFFSQLPR